MSSKDMLRKKAREAALRVAHLWTPSTRTSVLKKAGVRAMAFLREGHWYDRDMAWSTAARYVDDAAYLAACQGSSRGADYYAAKAAMKAATEPESFNEKTVEETVDAAIMAKAIAAKTSAHPEEAAEAFWSTVNEENRK